MGESAVYPNAFLRQVVRPALRCDSVNATFVLEKRAIATRFANFAKPIAARHFPANIAFSIAFTRHGYWHVRH
jgi:hypothetical protein